MLCSRPHGHRSRATTNVEFSSVARKSLSTLTKLPLINDSCGNEGTMDLGASIAAQQSTNELTHLKPSALPDRRDLNNNSTHYAYSDVSEDEFIPIADIASQCNQSNDNIGAKGPYNRRDEILCAAKSSYNMEDAYGHGQTRWKNTNERETSPKKSKIKSPRKSPRKSPKKSSIKPTQNQPDTSTSTFIGVMRTPVKKSRN